MLRWHLYVIFEINIAVKEHHEPCNWTYAYVFQCGNTITCSITKGSMTAKAVYCTATQHHHHHHRNHCLSDFTQAFVPFLFYSNISSRTDDNNNSSQAYRDSRLLIGWTDQWPHSRAPRDRYCCCPGHTSRLPRVLPRSGSSKGL